MSAIDIKQLRTSIATSPFRHRYRHHIRSMVIIVADHLLGDREGVKILLTTSHGLLFQVSSYRIINPVVESR